MRRIAERGLLRALRVAPNGRAAAVCSSAGVFSGVVVVGVRPASSLVSSFRETSRRCLREKRFVTLVRI